MIRDDITLVKHTQTPAGLQLTLDNATCGQCVRLKHERKELTT